MPLVLRVRDAHERLSLNVNTRPRAVLAFHGISVATQVKRVTPSDAEQDITGDAGYLLSEVIIEPIPSYYGRISYNGGILSVY